jgi:hypothetical protein
MELKKYLKEEIVDRLPAKDREKLTYKDSESHQSCEDFLETMRKILQRSNDEGIIEEYSELKSKFREVKNESERIEKVRQFVAPRDLEERLTALRWMNEQGGRDEYKTLLKYKDEILGDSSEDGKVAKSLFESALQRIEDRLWKQNLDAASGDAPDAKLRREIMELLDELYTPQGKMEWLNSPHYRCDGKTPQEMIDDGNARWVLNILGALAEGNHL